MLNRRIFIALSFIAVAACSSSSNGPPAKSVDVGSFTIATSIDGDNFVTHATATRTDDALTVTFDRASRSAKIEPRWGQARTVQVEVMPDDADAANKRISEPLAFGNVKAGSLGATSGGGLKPQGVDPPPPACTNPCFDACDAQFPDPAQNAACRFGCSNGCTAR